MGCGLSSMLDPPKPGTRPNWDWISERSYQKQREKERKARRVRQAQRAARRRSRARMAHIEELKAARRKEWDTFRAHRALAENKDWYF